MSLFSLLWPPGDDAGTMAIEGAGLPCSGSNSTKGGTFTYWSTYALVTPLVTYGFLFLQLQGQGYDNSSGRQEALCSMPPPFRGPFTEDLATCTHND